MSKRCARRSSLCALVLAVTACATTPRLQPPKVAVVGVTRRPHDKTRRAIHADRACARQSERSRARRGGARRPTCASRTSYVGTATTRPRRCVAGAHADGHEPAPDSRHAATCEAGVRVLRARRSRRIAGAVATRRRATTAVATIRHSALRPLRGGTRRARFARKWREIGPAPVSTLMTLRFTKMQGLGNDFVVDRRRAPARRARRRRRSARWPTAASASAATRCWSSSRAQRRRRLPLPDLQRRRRRGRAVRQRRALLRRVRARPRAHRQARDPRRDGRRAHRAAARGRRRGHGRHGRAAISPRGRSVRRRHGRGRRAARRRRRRRCSVSVLSMGNPHAVQVVADVDAAPVTTQGPAHRAPSALSRSASTRVTCRSSIALPFACACGSAARARRSRAAPARARRWWRASGAGLLDSPVRVMTRGGELAIGWARRRARR